jgi:hypothetical protein
MIENYLLRIGIRGGLKSFSSNLEPFCMIARDAEHFDLSEFTSLPLSVLRYSVSVFDIPAFRIDLARELVTKLKVDMGYIKPKVFVEANGGWVLVEYMYITVIKQPTVQFEKTLTTDLVINDFQNKYPITSNDTTEQDQINKDLADLVKLVLDSKNLSNGSKEVTVQALKSIADQVSRVFEVLKIANARHASSVES